MFDIQIVADFDDHKSEVWRVEWNVTGTVLTSSGDDGTIKMFKASVLDEWYRIGSVGVE